MGKSNYSNILISENTEKGMNLTIDDQKWIKLLFDRQDYITQEYISATYDEHAKLIISTVRELLEEHKKEIFNSLGRLEKSIEDLKKDVKEIKAETLDLKNSIRDHEFRIARLEKHLCL
jgi:septal ring factor EnvC (AmiA/AmiB activator)